MSPFLLPRRTPCTHAGAGLPGEIRPYAVAHIWSMALVCFACSWLASRRPLVYARFREPLTLAAGLFGSWWHVQTGARRAAAHACVAPRLPSAAAGAAGAQVLGAALARTPRRRPAPPAAALIGRCQTMGKHHGSAALLLLLLLLNNGSVWM